MCPLNKFAIANSYNSKEIINKSKKGNNTKIYIQRIIKYLNYKYLKYAQRNPDDIDLELSYITFLFMSMKNYYGALQRLSVCSKKIVTFFEKFYLYHYKRIIENTIQELKTVSEINYSLFVEYEKSLKQFEEFLKYCCLMHTQFWSNLSEESPDFLKVRYAGFEIIKKLRIISRLWERLQGMISNIPNTIYLFANFNLYVCNDKEVYNQLIKKMRNNNQDAMNKYKFFNKLSKNQSNLSDDGTPFI